MSDPADLPAESPEAFRKRLDENKQEMYRLLREQWAQKGFARPAPAAPSTVEEGAPAGFSAEVEERAAAVLADTDIERENARLHEQHYIKALDDALDARDFTAARQASKELSAYREAAAVLSKPKNHFTRVEFERRQQDAAAKDRPPSR